MYVSVTQIFTYQRTQEKIIVEKIVPGGQALIKLTRHINKNTQNPIKSRLCVFLVLNFGDGVGGEPRSS